jgi:hypothetical protein
VARKEAKFRAKASEEQLRLYVEQIYSPGSCEVKWYSDGRQHPVRDFRDVSSLISTLCDQVYCACPKIGIEMINCDLLSGSAARARREVAEAMVTKEGIEMLGFTGFGPEVAIYRTLFRQTGLHKLVDDNWQFSKPDGRSQPAMSTIWKALEEMLRPTENSSDGINVEDMIRHFKEPPFGIRQGPIPLFICHYLMVNSDIIALYQEGAYKPYFGEAEISLMVKRPELFSLRRYAPSGLSRDVVQAYLQVLNVDSAGFGADVRNPSLLKIVIPLLRFVEGLPTYTRFTRRISTRAQKLRGAILNSREPIDLLYQSIPAALDVKPIDGSDVLQKGWKENLRAHLLEGLTELNDAYKRLNEQIQNAVMVAFGYKSGEIALPAFRKATIKLIRPLVPACRDGELKPILGAMASDVSEDNDWVRGIAGQVIKKPLDQWHDSDIDPFLTQIVDIADRIEGMGSILAAGAGVAENGSNVLSIIRADVTAYRQVIKLTDSTAKDLIKRYPEIFDQPDKTKAVLAALLFDSLQIGK